MMEPVLIVGFGNVDTELLSGLAAGIGELFSTPTRVEHRHSDHAVDYNARRGQYSAEALVKRLHPDPGERILAVVDVDLYVPPRSFVVGFADGEGRRAVVALPRLRSVGGTNPVDNAELTARLLAEAADQLSRTMSADARGDDFVRSAAELAGRFLDEENSNRPVRLRTV